MMVHDSKLLALCVQELDYRTPLAVAQVFAKEKNTVFLHSATSYSRLAQYSYLGVRPYDVLISQSKNIDKKNQTVISPCNLFDTLSKVLESNQFECAPGLPPFQGGAMGYLSYDLNRQLEKIPKPRSEEGMVPYAVFGLYDLVFAWDHANEKLFLYSTGLPEEGDKRYHRAKERLQQVLLDYEAYTPKDIDIKVALNTKITSNFSKRDYIVAVKKAIDYIYAGDIFEVNLSQRFKAELQIEPFDLYLRLHAVNPAPFSGVLDFDCCQIVSSSPERFLRLSDGDSIEACPIKGTRPRKQDLILDQHMQQALIHSEKDRAENIMIVDLMRNDISRVSLPHHVKVPELCALQTFETVHHLVSTITGKLAPQYNAIDLIKACFPGGSITGAPKIRSMEIIAEIEPNARGPYCGSMGYIGFDGCMDLSILIRTFVLANNSLTFQAGGAITAHSNPEEEYQETLDKAHSLMQALAIK